MADLKQDLAALRIERAPERPGVGRWIVWTGLLIVLAALGFAGWRWATRERPAEVQVATVSGTRRGHAGGRAERVRLRDGRRRATVSSKITGKVIEVNVEEGMAVRQGQVLARLDDQHGESGARARRGAGGSRAARASRERSAARTGSSHGEAPRAASRRARRRAGADRAGEGRCRFARRAHRALKEQIRVTERQIELQQTELNNTVIRAPFSGIAISKDAQPGEMVARCRPAAASRARASARSST